MIISDNAILEAVVGLLGTILVFILKAVLQMKRSIGVLSAKVLEVQRVKTDHSQVERVVDRRINVIEGFKSDIMQELKEIRSEVAKLNRESAVLKDRSDRSGD